MNLVPITPPLRKGQLVQCAACLRMVAEAKADMDAKAFTFVCTLCEEGASK